MFIYWKDEGKSQWRLIENSDKGRAAAIQAGARFFSVLSVDQDVEHADADTKINYKGPLYFDIDSDNEQESLYDVRKLLLTLYREFGVRLSDLTVHMTGGKGFHVLVPSKVFSTGKAQAYLPYTYKNMALAFSLEHLDYGIYSAGRGRMWRIENIKRDSGRYKVQLSVAQVFGLGFDQILELSRHPGVPTGPEKKDPEYAAELAALFKRSEFKPRKIVAVSNERLVALNGDPPCVKKILALEGIKEGRRFNQIVMALCGYATGKGWSLDETEIRADKLIKDGPSSTYKKPRERLSHLRSIFKYFASSSDYHFDCIHMQKTVDVLTDNCPSCGLLAEVEAGEYDASLGITIANSCYYRRTETGRQQLTTFVVHPTSIIKFVDSHDAVYTMYAKLVSTTGEKADVILVQQDWISKAALLRRLPNPDFAYIGGDSDVQRIFHILSHIQVPKKTGVRTIGMHEVNGTWHFVCSEGSLSGDSEADALLLETDYRLPTKLLTTQPATKSELQEMVPLLFGFNALEVSVPIMGWFIATFYKERIFKFTRQFPLLFVFGAAGSGKTQTILTLKNMFALEGDNIKSIADVTNFTLIKSASANNTVPLLLDEYKSSTFSPFQVKTVSKLIRASYNNEAGERGTSSQHIIQYYYKSPIVIAGEQTVTEPAARDRIIEVHLSKAASTPHVDEFKQLGSMPLDKLGRLILDNALKIPQDDIKRIFDECLAAVPSAYLDRPRLNQAIIAMGIKLLRGILVEHNLERVLDNAWEQYWKVKKPFMDDDVIASQKTDVDRILEAIALMSETDRYQLSPGHDFVIDGKYLRIYMRNAYQLFLKYADEFKAEADTPNYTSFLKLIKKESYFVKDDVAWKLGAYQKLTMVLDIDKIKARKLNMASIIPLDMLQGDTTSNKQAGELKL